MLLLVLDQDWYSPWLLGYPLYLDVHKLFSFTDKAKEKLPVRKTFRNPIHTRSDSVNQLTLKKFFREVTPLFLVSQPITGERILFLDNKN